LHKKNIALLFCTITWFTHIFVRGGLPILLPLITKEFSLSYAQAGILVTSSLLVYALMQLPAGYLASKIGSRNVIVFGLCFLSVSSALLALSTDYIQFFVLTVLGAISTGCHLTVATALISNLFEETEIGKAIGTHESAVSLGSLASSAFILPMALLFSWRLTYLICAAFAFMITLMVRAFLPSAERPETELTQKPESTQGHFNKEILMLLLVMTIHAFVFQAASAFLPLYLSEEKKILLTYLAYYVAVPNILGLLGRPLGGYLSDTLGRRNVMLISSASLITGTILTVLISERFWLVLALALLGFGLHTAIPVMFAFMMSLLPSSKRALVAGRVNTIRLTVAAVSPAILGAIIDSAGFLIAFSTLTAFGLAGLLGTLRLKEKKDASMLQESLV